MKKAIFGGSFNPVHNDHLRLAERFLSDYSLDKVIFIPTYVTPLKDNASIADSSHRLAMCRLAVDGFDRFEVSDMEIRREGVSYTADTVAALKNPSDDLFLIVGADMFMTLDRWHDCRFIFENAVILAAVRDGIDALRLSEKYEELKPLGCRAYFSKTPVGGISSTLIRKRVKRGESISSLVPAQVEKYIREKGLYR